MEVAEGVGEAGTEEIGEALALLIGEAGAHAVGFGAGEVDFLVGDVEIATEDDGFLVSGFEVGEVFAEGFVPGHAVVEAAESVLSVGGVNSDEDEVRVDGGDDTAFFVVLVDAHVVDDVERFRFGKDGGAGVTGFFGGVPVGLVVAEFEGEFDLLRASFRFLKAEDVGVESEDVFGEGLFEDGADAVDVPGNQFH